MKKFAIKIAVNAVALWVASLVLKSGITFEHSGASTGQLVGTILIVALIFGLVNTFIRPVVKLFSFGLIILTLGLITFVINALMLWLTSAICAHFAVQFHVENFVSALLGSLVITVVSLILNALLPDDDK
ncbi:phage holin family protein [Actinospica sp. MGRD01-02]|uniref:Phage holin family protein n=1 Tax=Actinospica acidithermotolerans TaxID=2828514 RepID=A0A941EBS2_9ACTN|nr:phage holin family protein [Actinospica acidithermotolerans]MBR7828631.1 phage holin family protein [Actinospica acidithermotolerans]